MHNNDIEQDVSLEEIMKSADIAAGLDLDMPMEDEEFREEAESASSENATYDDEERGCWCKLPSIKINCDLEVGIGSKNKVIYVCPGKLQYFTASAISCCGDETIEIEYLGHNTKCVCGEKVICGYLGYYKIIKSGIVFIPRHNLSEFPDDWFPTDILPFKAKDRCSKDVEFDVVFTYSRCANCCERSCNKGCRY